MTEQGTPGYAYLDQPAPPGQGIDDEDDLLLMPGPQGSWSDPHFAPPSDLHQNGYPVAHHPAPMAMGPGMDLPISVEVPLEVPLETMPPGLGGYTGPGAYHPPMHPSTHLPTHSPTALYAPPQMPLPHAPEAVPGGQQQMYEGGHAGYQEAPAAVPYQEGGDPGLPEGVPPVNGMGVPMPGQAAVPQQAGADGAGAGAPMAEQPVEHQMPPAGPVIMDGSAVPVEAQAAAAPPANPPLAAPPPRRPLHMGPPIPDPPTGGVVRSLADRGPAVSQPSPQTSGPEYLDGPRDDTAGIPAQQTGEPEAPGGRPVAQDEPSQQSLIPRADSIPQQQSQAPGQAFPEAPAEAVQQAESAQQAEQGGPVEQAAAVESAVPAAAEAVAVEAVAPAEPAAQVEQAVPGEPAAQVEQAVPGEPVAPVAGVAPAEAGAPVAEQVVPAEAAAPVAEAAPAEPAAQVDPGAPAAEAAQVEAAVPVEQGGQVPSGEAVAPLAETVPAEAVAQAEAAPVEQAAPVEPQAAQVPAAAAVEVVAEVPAEGAAAVAVEGATEVPVPADAPVQGEATAPAEPVAQAQEPVPSQGPAEAQAPAQAQPQAPVEAAPVAPVPAAAPDEPAAPEAVQAVAQAVQPESVPAQAAPAAEAVPVAAPDAQGEPVVEGAAVVAPADGPQAVPPAEAPTADAQPAAENGQVAAPAEAAPQEVPAAPAPAEPAPAAAEGAPQEGGPQVTGPEAVVAAPASEAVAEPVADGAPVPAEDPQPEAAEQPVPAAEETAVAAQPEAAAAESAPQEDAPPKGRRGRRRGAPAVEQPAEPEAPREPIVLGPVETQEPPAAEAPAPTPAEPQPAAAAGPDAAQPEAAGAETAGAPAPEAVEPQAETPASETPAADIRPEDVPVPEAVPVPAAEPYDPAVRDAVHRVIRERRDVRNGFRPDPIPHDVLLRVLEAAHTAPSVGHSQPWDFVVIRSEKTREKMHELAMRQREAYANSLPKARARQFRELKIEAILDTPVNIVVTADPTRGGGHTLGRHTQPQMAPYSSALAVENLWLAARAEGLGVGWVSFFDERQMVAELGLPEHLEVVAYLCVGYVDEFPEEPELVQAGWSQRRPLSWVVHEEAYGNRALPGEQPHDLLEETLRGIRPLDAKALGEAWERQKRMTKPAGALGMLEIISAQLSGLSRQCPPPIPEPAAVAIFAGDHGVHAQGVTPWPQEVTAQMVANFLGGGAVCNAFANQVGAEVCVIDVGVAAELPATPGLLPRKVRPGTADSSTGPAMTREEALRAIEVGIETARDLIAAGNRALLTGEMGIANTTPSSAIIAVYTGADPAEVTGRGTGINDETHARKIEVVRRTLDLHRPDPADPIAVLSAVGGLEHAAMVGLLLGAAALRTPVILDGVSAGAAALVARAIAPEVLAACIAGHRSAEPGHAAALTTLGLRPLVDLDLRLGEGTGALLALPLVQSAARVMHEVATFDAAGVTEKA